jgi:hypothetical protein
VTSFPNSPRLLKGALVGLDPANPLASIIVFQYNPETVTRTLTPQTVGGQGEGDPLRLAGPPQETIRFDAVFDATDQLEQGKAPATVMGLHPQLAALEMMIYPKTARVIANEVLLQAGMIEVIPPEAPLTVLVWGALRVVPVRVTSFSITEEMFDPNLNPIHAKVSLEVRVLNYRDLGLASPGGAIFMTHQALKEVMATSNTISGAVSLSATVGG